MKKSISIAMTGIAFAAFAGSAACADSPKDLGSKPTPDQLIQMLAPKGGVTPTERGLRVHSASPVAADDRVTAPAVALDVKFAFNSADLTSQAKDTIQRLGAAFQSDQLAGYRFRVEGHTDATGSAPYNIALSKRRAEAVRDYLVNDLHVAPNRLVVVGKGQEDLLDPANPTSSVNRRVEVVNLGK